MVTAMTLTTPLTELLDIRHPVLLAPMEKVSGGALAAAVSNAGGLGLIGGGYGDAEWLEAEFARAGAARVGVGFITWSLARQPALLDLALEHRPAAVMLSFGDPNPFASAIKDAGAKLILQVQSLAQARAAAQAGADAVVAQGAEAGGHGAARGAMSLVPAVVDAVSVPVVAAGGIADGRGLAAALVLGAAGALIGTRFFATDEALGHANAKARLLEAGGDDTLPTSVFDRVRGRDWPAGYRGRAIANDFTRRWHGHEADLERAMDRERPRFGQAMADGDTDTGVVFAGEGLDLIQSVEPAAAVLGRLVGEAEKSLSAPRVTAP
jgi:nitronate monooxygenase